MGSDSETSSPPSPSRVRTALPRAAKQPPPPPSEPQQQQHAVTTTTTAQKSYSAFVRRRSRCNVCANCLRPECGTCTECGHKHQFGGDGRSRQACLARRCLELWQFGQDDDDIPTVRRFEEEGIMDGERVIKGEATTTAAAVDGGRPTRPKRAAAIAAAAAVAAPAQDAAAAAAPSNNSTKDVSIVHAKTAATQDGSASKRKAENAASGGGGGGPNSSSGSKVRRRVRCRQCVNCLKPECGKCSECKRKRQFGGDGSSRHACVQRRCLAWIEPADEDITATTTEEPVANNKRRRTTTSRPPSQAGTHTTSSDTEEQPSLSCSDPAAGGTQAPPLPVGPDTEAQDTLERRFELHHDDDGDIQSPVTAATTTNNADPENTATHMYGHELRRVGDNECSICLQSTIDQDDVILCDSCDGEFHLACCRPRLVVIPDGTWFCFDCSAHGAAAQLEQYLDHADDKRNEFVSSAAYVDHLVHKQLALQKGDGGSGSRRKPVSELERLADIHKTALEENLTRTRLGAAATGEDNATGEGQDWVPSFLLGRSIGLEIGTFHQGRIVDWRRRNGDEVEYLVRFLAGHNDRKTAVVRWMRLEEHVLCVGTTLVWCKFKDIWRPALLMLRTSRDLINARSKLKESLGQIVYEGSDVDSEYDVAIHKAATKGIWALARVFGHDVYELLNLKVATVDFFSNDAHSKHVTSDTIRKYVAWAMVEWEEVRAVRQWCKLPLGHPWAPHALSVRDELSAGPLLPTNRQGGGDTGAEKKYSFELCPTVPLGLDRNHMIKLLAQHGVPVANRDDAAGLVCSYAPIDMAQYYRDRRDQERRNKLQHMLTNGKETDAQGLPA